VKAKNKYDAIKSTRRDANRHALSAKARVASAPTGASTAGAEKDGTDDGGNGDDDDDEEDDESADSTSDDDMRLLPSLWPLSANVASSGDSIGECELREEDDDEANDEESRGSSCAGTDTLARLRDMT
jgi:hypothetical protein